MKTQVLLITGHTGTGKSALAKRLSDHFEFKVFKTSEHIRAVAQQRKIPSQERQDLKNLGDTLDTQTKHCWLMTELQKLSKGGSLETPIVVDSVRKAAQLEHFRKQTDLEVTHVHLYVDREEQEKRSAKRMRQISKQADISDVDLVKSERDIAKFKSDADIRINTKRTDANDTLTRVVAYLGLYPEPDRQCVDVLIGGQYGSEGKGQVAAYLAQEYDVLMRVGGPNAGHQVADETGKYTYHSLPSGCRGSTSDVLIGPGATIHIGDLLNEINECEIEPSRMYLDPNVMIISNSDRKNEKKLIDSIGSTGSGVGTATSRRILQRLHGRGRARLASSYRVLSPFVKPTHDRLQHAYARGEKVLLEGTQGSLLSLYHGDYPYVTSRDTNVSGCLAEAGISPRRVNRILMVVRFTPIRVMSPKSGYSGNLKHPTDFKTIAEDAGAETDLAKNETTSTTQKDRRVGWFEWENFRKACEINAPTDVILTFADYQHDKNKHAVRFEQLHEDTIKFVEELQRVAQAPVSIINTRYPHDEPKPLDLRTRIDRRSWRSKIEAVGRHG